MRPTTSTPSAASSTSAPYQRINLSNFQRAGDTWILAGEIDHPTVSDILKARYETDPERKVLFLIDSQGGLAHATLGLIRELEPLLYLETRALGQCASAAVHLLQSGAVRTCYPHGAFFLHSLHMDEAEMSGASIQSFATQFDHDTAAWVEVLARRTKRKRRNYWQRFLKSDQWLCADEALKMGLVDRIID